MTALAGPMRAFAAMTPQTESYPELSYVNPELRAAALPAIKWAQSSPPMSENYLAIRKQIDANQPKLLPGIPVKAHRVPVAEGIPDVTVYVINAGAGSRPAILHIHGGGMILGRAIDDVPAKQALAKALDCVIVTVDYALSPEVT
ncbi:acetyl esterase/lipase [Stakelama sediminis]|uniref:Acetyl esterase/lipase n=1 Tax=Stakelama sediminis TaxID=463200 RepID=A0A840Z0K0_9SPHN|nr:alpha/beta hydrolase fold domain-containing protein [Stakelama sediminis]MBB5719256.1 acetyl esterase/lipase [Stakelama sediminis]